MLKKSTIQEKYVAYLEVEKSKFYGILVPCDTKEEAESIILDVKKEYPKARHYCYAYKIDDLEKFSDDGEPSGTAGKPILSALNYANLRNVVLIVVRYFGGTLLGSGRLLRTYSKCAADATKGAKICNLVECKKVRVCLDIENYNLFKSFLEKSHFKIINTYFNDKITMDFLLPSDSNINIESLFDKKVKVVACIDYCYKEVKE